MFKRIIRTDILRTDWGEANKAGGGEVKQLLE